jgi:predicted O-methyltransferase YrrM
MSRRSSKKSWSNAWLSALALAVIVAVVATWLSPGLAIGVGVGGLAILMKALSDEVVSRVAHAQDVVFAQQECRQQLEQLLHPVEPLPTTRGYRGSPDFLLEIFQRIRSQRPGVILEASCGLSTVVCAYALRQVGAGAVISLEHEELFADLTRRDLVRHGLSDLAQVHHAPIVTHQIDGHPWLWYDYARAPLPSVVDMVVVDGPPSTIQKMARFPALPLLIDRLKVGGVLLLDDADRGGERRAVEAWESRFKNIKVERLAFDKGLVVVTKLAPH